MQHIDRKELYTNLEARIQYLHSFLDFSSRTYFALTYPPLHLLTTPQQATSKPSQPAQNTYTP
jgi:hypothetical protein